MFYLIYPKLSVRSNRIKLSFLQVKRLNISNFMYFDLFYVSSFFLSLKIIGEEDKVGNINVIFVSQYF